MTIAMCYISPEGIVLGADSTASISVDPGGYHYFNHNQKIFEIGEGRTLAIVTWGLGGLNALSHRTLIALLADDLALNPPATVLDVATRWSNIFWDAFSADAGYGPMLQRCAELRDRPPHDPEGKAANARTEEEERELQQLRFNLFVGFVIGGYVLPDRAPAAFEIAVDPLAGKPTPLRIEHTAVFRGAPNIIQRLLFGCDDEFEASILRSPHWNGTPADFADLRRQHTLSHPLLPIRDAVDFVHTCISSTIKAFKFSNWSQICGGPIELAVITSDRKFRWVRHKEWDSAISDGGT